MNPSGTMDPRVLLSKTPPQPSPNVLFMKDALKLATRLREPAQSQSEPKSHGATSPRICGRCGKTGHIATEVGDDGMYKCPTRLAESLLPAAELNLRRAQASAEIEAIKNSLSQSILSTPSHSPTTTTSSLPADPFNRNWRLHFLVPQRKWNQPKPSKKREHYIEYLEKENLQLPIWKVNYFELYISIQKGSSSEKYPYQAGRERMIKLYLTNLRLMRDAKAKSRAQLEKTNKDVAK